MVMMELPRHLQADVHSGAIGNHLMQLRVTTASCINLTGPRKTILPSNNISFLSAFLGT